MLQFLSSLSKVIELRLLGVVLVVAHVGHGVIHVALLRLDHRDQGGHARPWLFVASLGLLIFHLRFLHLLDAGVADHQFVLVGHVVEENGAFVEMVSSFGLILVEVLLMLVAYVVVVHTHVLKLGLEVARALAVVGRHSGVDLVLKSGEVHGRVEAVHAHRVFSVELLLRPVVVLLMVLIWVHSLVVLLLVVAILLVGATIVC